jgi:cytochrome b561
MHWTMALIIIPLLAIGIYMANFLDKEAPNRMMIYGLHKSFGALVLFLIVFRIFVRLSKAVPPLPSSMSVIVQRLSHSVHVLLYLFMILLPLSGYLMSNFFGYPVHMFGIELPMLVEKNPELGQFFHSAHKYLGYGLIAVLLLHIIAVVKHRFFDLPENDVLKRMF